MFERFTPRARQIVVVAQREAARLNHDYIGTEHLLLALIAVRDPIVESAVAARLTLDAARTSVEDMIGLGGAAPSGHIPFTPTAKKVLELSLREAMALRHRNIEAGHILLGILREGEGVGARVVAAAGIDFAEARAAVVDGLGEGTEQFSAPRSALSRFLRRDRPTVVGEFQIESTPGEVVASLGHTTVAAAAAIGRAFPEHDVPTPWTLLVALAEGDDFAASLLAGVELTSAAAPVTSDLSRVSFMAVLSRASGLARALASAPAPVDTPHLLAVLLSPGKGSVVEHVAALGVDASELRRRTLALL